MFLQKYIPIASIVIALLTTNVAADTQISGEMKKWHKITITFDGPNTSENAEPNPFLSYRLNVTFRHAKTGKEYVVPGYYAADGQAGNTSATSGNKWRVHFSPDEIGLWTYAVSFRRGENIAVDDDPEAGESAGFFDGAAGSFQVDPSDKQPPDFRASGRLRYVGKRYMQFAETGECFLKAGPDSPETMLAYADFDGTYTRKVPLKTYEAHIADWKSGDPTWRNGRGKALIGALNYLASKGLNTLSFLTYNAGGDGDNVWPFNRRNAKVRYDCSKLDQWQIVFDHAQARGIHLNFKTQETENDDNVPESLDGGNLGVERKLYYRELVARFGYLLAATWNLGEENSQTTDQQKAMAAWFATHDPYRHNVVLHTFPPHQNKIYEPLLGKESELTGVSLQNHWAETHTKTLYWVNASERAGKPWVVANDEQNPASHGVPPDPGYQGFEASSMDYSADSIRHHTLWGNLMAGGSGVEYYFGYDLPQNDLICEDWRSRDRSWTYAGIALKFFRTQKIPVERMHCDDTLTARDDDYCFFKEGEIYLIYLRNGGSLDLHLSPGKYEVGWFNPRTGEGMNHLLQKQTISGPTRTTLTAVDNKDWLLVIRCKNGGKILRDNA